MPGMYFITEHALYRSLARAALLAEDDRRAASRGHRDAAPGRGDVPQVGRRLAVEPRPSACAGRGRDRRRWPANRTAPSTATTRRSSWRARAASFNTRRWPTSSPPGSTCAGSGPRSRAPTCKRPGTAYRQWGAKGKAKQLAERYPDLLAGVEPAPATAPRASRARRRDRRRPAPRTRRGGSTWSPPCAPPRRWPASWSSAACSNG